MRLTFDTYNIKQHKREIKTKKKDVMACMVVIEYLKSSGDDLLLQKQAFLILVITFFETKSEEHVAILD